MKRAVLYGVAGFLLMALLPFLAFSGNSEADLVFSETQQSRTEVHQNSGASDSGIEQEKQGGNSAGEQEQKQGDDNSGDKEKSKATGVFKILDTSCGKVVTISEREFCIGAVAYEMPPTYEAEALKAQCVACYTHFCYWRQKQKESPDTELQGADFKADLSKHEYYMDEKYRREKWGTLYEKSEKAVAAAVDSCLGECIVTDEGVPADVAYFAISSGVTEDAKDIFGFDSPYLKSVSSPYDKTAPDYKTVVVVSKKEFCEVLHKEDSNFSQKADSEIGIGRLRRTANGGSILSAEIGGCRFSGETLRRCFHLRSSCFSVKEEKESIIFTVLGYGHGVGMSQYGANEMAKQGADYKEILSYYYNSA